MKQLSLDNVFDTYLEKKSLFQNREVLSSDYIPETAVHREQQANHLASMLAPALRDMKISNIFIYGKTGTGKTLVTKHVTSELEKRSKKIKILYINCKMKKISDTEYRLLAELTRLMGKEVPVTGLPTDQIYRMFFNSLDSENKKIILILDEIDSLVKKIGDDILYNLTRINNELNYSKVSIIGISNNVSFTENLDPRVKSTLSEEEIVFPPYNATQLYDILYQRYKSAFHNGSVDISVLSKCAALAAQEHGDARKALDLLRIAAELVERKGGQKVTTYYVDMAEEKLDSNRMVTIVRSLPKQSLAVLSSIINLAEKNQEDIQTGDVYSIYEKICSSSGLKILTQRRVSDLVAELDMLSVINTRVISKGRYGRTREIRFLLTGPILQQIKQILKENYLA